MYKTAIFRAYSVVLKESVTLFRAHSVQKELVWAIVEYEMNEMAYHEVVDQWIMIRDKIAYHMMMKG